MRSPHLLLIWLLATPALGQVAADSVLHLGEVTVVATRFDVADVRNPSSVTVVDAVAIRSAGSHTLADVLDRHSSVALRRYGPNGLAGLSIRGSSSSQALILLDGSPLVEPQLGQLDIALLPSELFSRIEIARGPTAALHGSNAVGGTVSLATDGLLSRGATASATLGPYGERSASARVAGAIGAVDAAVVGSIRSSDGDFTFINEALFPAREQRRLNADIDQETVMGSLRHRGRSSTSRVSLLHTRADRGLPGVAFSVPVGERQTDRITRAWGSFARAVPFGEARGAVSLHRGSIRYLNPRLDIDDEGVSTVFDAELGSTFRRHSGESDLGVSVSHYDANHPSLQDAAETRAAAFTSSVLATGRLRLYPAARLDVFDPRGGTTKVVATPRLGINARMTTTSAVRGSVSRLFRMPTLNDRFWRGVGALGNGNLQPEHGWSAEAGYSTRGPGVDMDVTGFAARVEDQIQWFPDSDGIWSPRNVGRVRTIGLEAGVRGGRSFGESLHAAGSVDITVMQAVDRSDKDSPAFGRQLRYTPATTIASSASVERGGAGLAAIARIYGPRNVTADGTQTLPSLVALDIDMSTRRHLGPASATFSIVLENATGRQYEFIAGYPVAPRSLRFRLLIETNRLY